MTFLADIAAGVFMGVLTGMGIGGGGLLVIYLTAVASVSQLEAQGCNLLFFVLAATSSLYFHGRAHENRHSFIGVAAILAVIGSFAGVGLASVVSEELLRRVFGAMLVSAGTLSAVRSIAEPVRRFFAAGKHGRQK